MAIRYVIKNKRGNYLPFTDSAYFTKDIEKAMLLSKSEAKFLCYTDLDETISKVDVQITEINNSNYRETFI